MTHVCCICSHLINDGDRVSVLVESTYHCIKSTNSFALDKYDLVSDSSTMCHVKCGGSETTNGK